MDNLAKESEILFIWDTRLSNPNGDMMSDNANRFDEIDEKAIVSDVRIKRTVRDYIQYHKNIDILIYSINSVTKATYNTRITTYCHSLEANNESRTRTQLLFYEYTGVNCLVLSQVFVLFILVKL